MERPSLGVLNAEFDLEPGIGGRRRGAGEDMVGGGVEEREGAERLGDSLEATMGNFVCVPPL
jgi:hypothetical protein